MQALCSVKKSSSVAKATGVNASLMKSKTISDKFTTKYKLHESRVRREIYEVRRQQRQKEKIILDEHNKTNSQHSRPQTAPTHSSSFNSSSHDRNASTAIASDGDHSKTKKIPPIRFKDLIVGGTDKGMLLQVKTEDDVILSLPIDERFRHYAIRNEWEGM